jgi:hypothetical protein
MQTIIKTAPDSNFTIYANDLINSDIPSVPKNLLMYLLSKPVTWQLKTHDLRKQLGLSAYAVKKGLRWLCSAGFAAYTRLKTGHTIWRIFDKPQVKDNSGLSFAQSKANSEFRFTQPETGYSPAIPPQVEIPQVVFQPVLVITETEEINKPLPEPPLRFPEPTQEQQQQVVVDLVDSDLIYPVQLNPVQKKGARHVIKKCNPELQQPVLFALAYALAQNKVKSPVAYLNGLITRANAGTFEPVGTTTATKQGSRPLIPIWQGFSASTPSKPEKAKGFIQQAKQALRG